jgi:hypothetical protein
MSVSDSFKGQASFKGHESVMESLDRIEVMKKDEDYEDYQALGRLEKGKIYDLMGRRKDDQSSTDLPL